MREEVKEDTQHEKKVGLAGWEQCGQMSWEKFAQILEKSSQNSCQAKNAIKAEF